MQYSEATLRAATYALGTWEIKELIMLFVYSQKILIQLIDKGKDT